MWSSTEAGSDVRLLEEGHHRRLVDLFDPFMGNFRAPTAKAAGPGKENIHLGPFTYSSG